MLLPALSPAGLVLLGLAALARAAVTPNTPPTANVGAKCTITWLLDTTKTWTSFDIDLMTGADLSMVKIKRVASKLDGTTGTGTYTYTCPNVTPNAPIYFYQMTMNGLDPTWTTRFTIASATGAVVAAQHPTQPDGSPKPWGIGKLAKSSAKAAASATATDSAAATATDNASPTATDSAGEAATTDSAVGEASATDDGDSSTATSDSAATATAVAKSTSSYAGPFSNLAATPRILVWVGIGVGGALLLGLLGWAICCCRRKSAANARESTFGDAGFSSSSGGAVRLPIRHPSHLGTSKGGYGEMGRGVDVQRKQLTVDTDRAKWDNGLASPRSPYQDEKRGWSPVDERYEMQPPLPSPQPSFTYSDAHGNVVESPPPGWTAPAHYGTGASHSAISMHDEGRPLVPAFANGQSEQASRPELARQPSKGLGTLAGRSYRQAQEARYTQYNMGGHAYEAEGRAWASEKSPTTPTGQGAGWI